jgi:CubicO group peptidase (beta-lactamase class C family)
MIRPFRLHRTSRRRAAVVSVVSVVLCALRGGSAAAIPTQTQDPGAAGDGRLAAVLEGVRSSTGLPALGGLVLRGDSVIEVAAVGLRAVGSPESVTVNDPWHLGSNTKAMTATLAGILVERGLITWETTIADVFPELADSMRPEYRDVRLEELLSHTGGITADVARTPLWFRLRADSASPRAQRERWVPEILRAEPGAARGTYLYSNLGYVVAGAMLERVAGESWEGLMRRDLFAPLVMPSAGFGPPEARGGGGAPLGHLRGQDGSYRPVQRGPLADNPAALGPAGTVHANLRDYARFIAAHLAGERGRSGLVSAETFARLHTPPRPGTSYGLGWMRVEREWARGDAFTHAGSNGMWYAVVWIAPERDFAVIAVTNAGGEVAAQGTDQAAATMIRRVEGVEGRR